MSDIISLNGKNYMKVPDRLIVEMIFAEMIKCWTFDKPDYRYMDRLAKDLSMVIDGAARREGLYFSRMRNGNNVVVKDGIISILEPIPAGTVIGQFNVATAEVKAFMASELISTEDYAQLKSEMPKLIRREIKSLNAKVINAMVEAVAHRHFGMFGVSMSNVYFNNYDNWVRFESYMDKVSSKSGVRVRWNDGKVSHEKFIALAELTD